MTQSNFFDFVSLLKGFLIIHKLNIERERFNIGKRFFRLEYRKSEKSVTHKENEPFNMLTFFVKETVKGSLHVNF